MIRVWDVLNCEVHIVEGMGGMICSSSCFVNENATGKGGTAFQNPFLSTATFLNSLIKVVAQ